MGPMRIQEHTEEILLHNSKGELLLSSREATALLELNQYSMFKMVESKRLIPAGKHAGVVYFRKSDVDMLKWSNG